MIQFGLIFVKKHKEVHRNRPLGGNQVKTNEYGPRKNEYFLTFKRWVPIDASDSLVFTVLQIRETLILLKQNTKHLIMP